ncbi:hypothetical protein [Persicobacter diffluens]|uniref:Uncharacterized protein n=1 Tax=Persicobacter diffluens TaxID=981 RepID=A0AAN4VZG3_9BACT|nr:hypothetical protein PEDI_17420 [Persicobacter diffluens]
MDKKKLTEADIRTKFITPAIENGFLAPFKVVPKGITIDGGLRATKGLVDKYSHEME